MMFRSFDTTTFQVCTSGALWSVGINSAIFLSHAHVFVNGLYLGILGLGEFIGCSARCVIGMQVRIDIFFNTGVDLLLAIGLAAAWNPNDPKNSTTVPSAGRYHSDD